VAYAAWPYEAPELEYEVGDVSNLLAPAGTLLRVALAVSGAIGDPLILLVLLALWITAPIRQRNQARATIVSNETLLLANDAQALGDEMRAIHGFGTSLNDLIELMAAVVDEQVTVEYLSSRPLDVPASVLDITRARAQLGWSPSTDLVEGISCTSDWISSLSTSPVGCSEAGERGQARDDVLMKDRLHVGGLRSVGIEQ